MDRSPSPLRSFRGAAWIAAALLALAVFLTFRGAVAGGMLQWDDDINVRNNPHVHALTWENIRWMFSDAQYMRRYLPLGWLRWAADYAAYGPGPRSFHVGNLLFHMADALLLFALIRRILRTVPASPAAMEVAAGIGALAWAIHPLRAETVAWISTGQYCQAVFFLLLSFLAYLSAVAPTGSVSDSPAGKSRAWAFLAGSVLAFAASLLSYPAALGYAGALVILDWLVLGRCSDRGAWRRVLLEKIPFVAVTAAVLAATVASRYHARGIWSPPPTLAEFGAGSRIMQAFYVWAYFLWKPLLPLRLSPVYTTLVRFDPLGWPFVASAVVVLGLSFVLIRERRRWPGSLAAWLCHLVLLVPMLGLTEHPHYASDRYNYLASLVWSVALAGFLLRLRPFPIFRWTVTAAALAALALAGAASAAQVGIWRDSETLFRAMLARLGPDPYRYDILIRLGRLLSAEGKPAQAEGAFREALSVRPNDAEARGRLGLALFEQGRSEAAAEFLGAAARLDPGSADARAAFLAGLLRAGLGDDAIAFGTAAVRLDPESADSRFNLALVLHDLGRKAEADAQLSEALRLRPNFPPALQAQARWRSP